MILQQSATLHIPASFPLPPVTCLLSNYRDQTNLISIIVGTVTGPASSQSFLSVSLLASQLPLLLASVILVAHSLCIHVCPPEALPAFVACEISCRPLSVEIAWIRIRNFHKFLLLRHLRCLSVHVSCHINDYGNYVTVIIYLSEPT